MRQQNVDVNNIKLNLIILINELINICCCMYLNTYKNEEIKV